MRLTGQLPDDRWLGSYARAEAARVAVRRARDEAAAARLDAKEARQAKAAFLSGLNHELRTPLNAITGFAGLLKETLDQDLPPKKKAEYLDHILQSAGVLLERIDAILSAASKPAPGASAGPTDPIPVLRRLIQEHAATVFVGKVDIEDDVGAVALPVRDLYSALQNVFTALVSEGGERQPIGLSIRSSANDESQIDLAFAFLTNAPHVTPEALRPVESQLRRQNLRLALTDDDGGKRLVLKLARAQKGAAS